MDGVRVRPTSSGEEKKESPPSPPRHNRRGGAGSHEIRDFAVLRSEAEREQAHGGLKREVGGRVLQKGGRLLQGTHRRPRPRDVPLYAAGKLMEYVGEKLEQGLPQDKSQAQILEERGFDSDEVVQILTPKGKE